MLTQSLKLDFLTGNLVLKDTSNSLSKKYFNILTDKFENKKNLKKYLNIDKVMNGSVVIHNVLFYHLYNKILQRNKNLSKDNEDIKKYSIIFFSLFNNDEELIIVNNKNEMFFFDFFNFSPIFLSNNGEREDNEGETIKVKEEDVSMVNTNNSTNPFPLYIENQNKILSIAITNTDNKYIAVGYLNGSIKIFNRLNGKLLKSLLLIHTSGISSLTFASDNTKLLSASQDNLIKLIGLKSGKILKEFR